MYHVLCVIFFLLFFFSTSYLCLDGDITFSCSHELMTLSTTLILKKFARLGLQSVCFNATFTCKANSSKVSFNYNMISMNNCYEHKSFIKLCG